MLSSSKLLVFCLASWFCTCSCLDLSSGEWKSCAGSAAAFDVQAVNLQPNVVSPGGSLRLVVSVLNKQPSVTAGSATIKVYYYGWWVLTASGTMCEGPAPPSGLQTSPASSISAGGMSTAHRRVLRGVPMSSCRSWSGWTWLDGTPFIQGGSKHLQPHHQPSSSSSSNAWLWDAVRDDTCVLPAGPLQLHHDASLPGIAPRGNYRMQLSAADAVSGQELMCVDVWFKVA